MSDYTPWPVDALTLSLNNGEHVPPSAAVVVRIVMVPSFATTWPFEYFEVHLSDGRLVKLEIPPLDMLQLARELRFYPGVMTEMDGRYVSVIRSYVQERLGLEMT